MGKRKTIVFILSGLLILLAVLVEYARVQWTAFPLWAVVSCEGGEESIELWQQNEDTCYLFLPSFADPAKTQLKGHLLNQVTIAGQSVDSGLACGDFPMNQPLRLTYRQYGTQKEANLIIMQSAGVAAMYIDVVSGSMDYIHEKKGNAEPGSLRLYTADGTLDCSTQIRAINGRGNSTWLADKKPYSMELSTSEDLLQMGAAEKWILLPNVYDNTNLRNRLTYDFAAEVGAAYSPECRWVDVFLNGEYNGLYLLSERNEIHPQRIAIDENESFLLSKDYKWFHTDDNPHAIETSRGDYFRVRYAGMSDEQILYHWESVENAIYADDGIDFETGMHWTELIDLDSWAQQFLLGEVFQNNDSGALSLYFYYNEQLQKVYAGPIWDMDYILDRDNTHLVNCLVSARPYIWNLEQESLLYKLYQKEEFHQRVIQMYYQQFRPLLQRLVDEKIDLFAEEISVAAAMNNLRWDSGDAALSTKIMREYLRKRMDFLDTFWSEEDSFCSIMINIHSQWRRLVVRRGETAEFLRLYTDIPWYVYDTGEPFDITAPVTQDWVLECFAEE